MHKPNYLPTYNYQHTRDDGQRDIVMHHTWMHTTTTIKDVSYTGEFKIQDTRDTMYNIIHTQKRIMGIERPSDSWLLIRFVTHHYITHPNWLCHNRKDTQFMSLRNGRVMSVCSVELTLLVYRCVLASLTRFHHVLPLH